MEEELRQKAISRYCKGEKPKSIYTDLGRSKVWFFKWLKRYQGGGPATLCRESPISLKSN